MAPGIPGTTEGERKAKNIPAGLPSSIPPVFSSWSFRSLAPRAGFSHSKWERIAFRKKNWKSIEIHEEADDQRNLTVQTITKAAFSLFTAVQLNPWVGPGDAVTTGLHWAQERALEPAAPPRHRGQKGPGTEYVKNRGSACTSGFQLLMVLNCTLKCIKEMEHVPLLASAPLKD